MSSLYPLALYRDGDTIEWDGRKVGYRTVSNADEHEAALDEGWMEGEDFLKAESEARDLLGFTADEIKEALPDLDLTELEGLKVAEEGGKKRKGVLADIEAAIKAKREG